jgi:hypothetical protein
MQTTWLSQPVCPSLLSWPTATLQSSHPNLGSLLPSAEKPALLRELDGQENSSARESLFRTMTRRQQTTCPCC